MGCIVTTMADLPPKSPNGLWYPGPGRHRSPVRSAISEPLASSKSVSSCWGRYRTLLLLLVLMLLLLAVFHRDLLLEYAASAKQLVLDGLKMSEQYAKDVGATTVLGIRVPLGPAVIMGMYVVSCILLLPLFGFHSVSGYLYGTIPGALLVTASQTLGASCCLYLARWIAGRPLKAWLERRWGKKYQAIETAIEQDAFKIMLMMRLSPVIPFALSNYVAGCSKVPIGKFAAGTWLGIAPGTTFYVGLGHVMRLIEENQMSEEDREGIGKYKIFIVGGGLVATAKLLHLASQRATKVLEEAGFQDEPKKH